MMGRSRVEREGRREVSGHTAAALQPHASLIPTGGRESRLSRRCERAPPTHLPPPWAWPRKRCSGCAGARMSCSSRAGSCEADSTRCSLAGDQRRQLMAVACASSSARLAPGVRGQGVQGVQALRPPWERASACVATGCRLSPLCTHLRWAAAARPPRTAGGRCPPSQRYFGPASARTSPPDQSAGRRTAAVPPGWPSRSC